MLASISTEADGAVEHLLHVARLASLDSKRVAIAVAVRDSPRTLGPRRLSRRQCHYRQRHGED